MTGPVSTSPRTWRVAAGALILLGLALRLHTIDTGFWHDELFTFALHARVPFHAIPVLNVDGGDHMLLHFLYHASRWLFGPHEWAARLPDLLAGLLFLALIGRFTRKVYGDRATALLAVGLVASSPIHVQCSQFARGYGLQISFALGLYWICWRALEQTAWRRGWAEAAAGLLALCGIYNSATWALFVAGLVTVFGIWGFAPWLPVADDGRLRARRLFAALAIGAAGAFAACQPVLDQTFRLGNVMQQVLGGSPRERLVSTYADLADISTTGLAPWLLAACVPGLAILRKERPRLLAIILGSLLVPPLVLGAADLGGPGRHFLFLYPLIVPALARGLLAVVSGAARLLPRGLPHVRRSVLAGSLTVLLGGLQISSLATGYYTQWRANDLKIVRDGIRARVGSHDLLIVNIPDSYFLLGYYLGGEIEDRMFDMIRDRRLDGLWYATRVLTEPTGTHVVTPDWIPPGGIPVGTDLSIGPLYHYAAGADAMVRVPARSVRWMADWGIVRLYRIEATRIEKVRYGGYAGDREAGLLPVTSLTDSLQPDFERRMEGSAALRLRSAGTRAGFTIPPAFEADAGPDDWWVALAAVNRRDAIDLGVRQDKDTPDGSLDRYRVNGTVGPLNHAVWNARTYDILKPAWIPSCWLAPLPPGRLLLREAVIGEGEGWIDGIQSHIVRFPRRMETAPR